MYNDCWGEVGWTIIDYYLRRKPSWYFVRRAYAPMRLILRAKGEDIRAVIANDTPDSLSLELEYGYISLDGSFTDLKVCRVEVPALERTELCVFPRGDHDSTRGLWIARVPGNRDIAPAIFHAVDYRKLKTTDPGLSLSIAASGERQCTIRVSARAYAHAAHFTLPDGASPSDNYFDLLPGETREIHILSSEPLDPAAIGVTCVNAPRL